MLPATEILFTMPKLAENREEEGGQNTTEHCTMGKCTSVGWPQK